MAKRNKRNSRSSKPLILVLVIIALAVVGLLAMRSSRTRSALSVEQTTESQAAASVLESVAVPDGVASRIVRYPGFTLSYNKEAHLPNWVAWELTRDEANAGQVSRKESVFAEDRGVEGSPTLDDYRRSGYDRGHMAPAGDMKWSKAAMDACFLLPNITPQKKELNAGAWNKLEEKCRQWALRDSAIWIVCGPVLTDSMPLTIGRTGVRVPERFYKVIVSPNSNPPRGIGFVMPNTNVSGGMQATAMSIDEVERITGLDFFSSLPDEIEELVESQCNYPSWNRR